MDYTTHAAKGVIERVEGDGDHGWSLTYASSSFGNGCFLATERMSDEVADDLREHPPQVGDEIVVYTYLGSRIRGFDLRGEHLYYQTDEELDAEAKLMRIEQERKDEEAFEKNRAKLDADYEALPQVFKDRIDKYRQNNPDFRKKYESYEMFCCTQAVLFADWAAEAVKSGEWADEVDAFWADEGMVKKAWRDASMNNLPESPEVLHLYWWSALNSEAYGYQYKRLAEVMPGYDGGHSGNTFGAALAFARTYIESPEYVAQWHGALAPLVGSDEYGDRPKEPAAPEHT